MDFFAAQDNARRTSRFLVLWFVLAVLGLIAAAYVAMVFAMGFTQAEAEAAPQISFWDPELFLATALGVGGLILIGSTYKVFSLSRHGGARIAEELGGRAVSRGTSDTLERRLINVVDEMAIASGIPAPAVYVLDQEAGINAFAAGASTKDGVVAVTRGTLEQLDRDELQGVIAHEFSHILNGDMRLNLKLIGVLHGILLLTLAGRVMMYSRGSRGRGAAPMVIGGLALLVVGYVGVLFGNLIKAGVSRQREYLADASAVQFTRNPAGISGALKKIAGIGSEIQHPRAEEASHMFFGSGAHFSSLLATHPPIEQRIKRLDPSFDASQVAPAGRDASATMRDATPAAAGFSPMGFTAAIGNVTPENLSDAHALLEHIPVAALDAVHQADGARAVVFALLLSRDEAVREKQLSLVASRFGASVRESSAEHAAWLADTEAALRLPVLDLCLPTLAEQPSAFRNEVMAGADALIDADGSVSLFEYVLRRLLRATLEPAPENRLTPRVSAKSLKSDTARLLALLAKAGETTSEKARQAFVAATAVAPLDGPWSFSGSEAPLTLRELDRILEHLGATKPLFRKALVEACATSVQHDGRVSIHEAELLRAVCQALDCPAPPLRVTG